MLRLAILALLAVSYVQSVSANGFYSTPIILVSDSKVLNTFETFLLELFGSKNMNQTGRIIIMAFSKPNFFSKQPAEIAQTEDVSVLVKKDPW